MSAHELASDVLVEQGVEFGTERDHADIGGIALVAGSCVRDIDQLYAHHETSTVVCTTRLSMSAGQ